MFENVKALSYRNNVEINHVDDPYYIEISATSRVKTSSMEFQHFHNHYEIYCLLDGSAGVIIEGQYYIIYEGDIVVERPGRLHKGLYFEEESVRRILLSVSLPKSLLLSPEVERHLLSPFNAEMPIFRFRREKSEKLISLLVECLQERDNVGKASVSEFYLQGKVMEFLYMFSKAIRTEENSYVNYEFDKITSKVYSVSNYIHKHYNENLSLELLADKFYVSSFYLSRRFKEISGYSIVQFIQQTRVKNAQERLMNSDESIQEICDECGFSSFSQFSRIFRKICGMTPREYRQKHQDGFEPDPDALINHGS